LHLAQDKEESRPTMVTKISVRFTLKAAKTPPNFYKDNRGLQQQKVYFLTEVNRNISIVGLIDKL